MIYLIMGKSATGKDTVLQRLLQDKELQLKRMTQYTTRPMKAGELDGREYYFTDEEGMHRLDSQGHILECRKYNTVYGDWYYFTTDEGIHEEEDYVLIGTLDVLEALRKKYKDIKAIYLYLDDGERLQRALDRERAAKEPRYTEMCRRFLTDEEDFQKEELDRSDIDLFVENKDLELTMKQINTFIKGV